MARIRTIKPEAMHSQTLAGWKREVRLAWHYLSMYLDDKGRGLDNAKRIAGELFPNDDDVTTKRMESWLQVMAEKPEHDPSATPPLCRYEVDSIRYIHAPKFLEHQRINRPTGSRIPSCPIHEPEGLF